MIVVSDTSPVSNLLVIGRLDLLERVYGEIIIPPKVYEEIIGIQQFGISIEPILLADWIKVLGLKDPNGTAKLRSVVDEGEAEAIALALEIGADQVLIDERLGAKVAESMGLSVVGLLGVLLKAKDKNILQQVRPVLDDLVEKAGFWIGPKVRERFLLLASEIES